MMLLRRGRPYADRHTHTPGQASDSSFWNASFERQAIGGLKGLQRGRPAQTQFVTHKSGQALGSSFGMRSLKRKPREVRKGCSGGAPAPTQHKKPGQASDLSFGMRRSKGRAREVRMGSHWMFDKEATRFKREAMGGHQGCTIEPRVPLHLDKRCVF